MSKDPPGRYITASSRHLQSFINKRLEPYNIGGGQYLFLISIYHHEGLYQDELSELEHVDKITTSKMVKKLVEAGYVRKEADPGDRRFFRLYLTKKGHDICPFVRRTLQETSEILTDGFTQEEQRQMRALLPRMLSNVAQRTRMMKVEQQFSAKVANIKSEIDALPEMQDADTLQYTAARLEALHFTPTLLIDVPRFLYLSKNELLAEIDRVAALSEQELHDEGIEIQQEAQEIKLEQIGLLSYHFKLLNRLRRDDADAWDEVDELYGDD